MKKHKLIDKSPHIHQGKKLSLKINIKEQQTLTDKQKEFLELALKKESKIIFVSGPAGTSKTYLSILSALKLLNERKVSDLIYIRSAVESSDSKLGFLPGESHEKMAPYLQPLIDKLEEFLSRQDIDFLQKNEHIDSVPVGFLRGLNWNAKVIISDESQNMTTKELVTLVTRVGEFSKLFILGDPDQSDIGSKSGFKKMVDLFSDDESKENGVYTFEFNEDDIVRSKLVKFLIKKIKKSV
jgi:phosphate starvation-inducible protein PhoH and related proteins